MHAADTPRRRDGRGEAGGPQRPVPPELDRLAAKLLAPATGLDRGELIVAHGNVIRYLVTKALAVDSMAWLGMSIGHASLTVLTVDAKGAARVIAVGDVGHLPPAFQTGAAGNPERSLALP